MSNKISAFKTELYGVLGNIREAISKAEGMESEANSIYETMVAKKVSANVKDLHAKLWGIKKTLESLEENRPLVFGGLITMEDNL